MQTLGFPKRKRLFPFLVLALSLLFTCWATYYLAAINRTKNLARFTNATLQVENAIDDSLNAYVALLRGGTGLFAASENVTRDEFRAYFERLRVAEFYPGMFGFGFAQRVDPDERQAVIDEIHRQGRTNFTIWPTGERDVCFPIVYIEPMNWRNQRALGFDMFSEPVRHEAMTKAAARGFALSGKVTLVQETSENQQAGFLLYVGLYKKGDFPTTESARMEQLGGFIYSPFRADDLFQGIYRGHREFATNLEVYDGEEVREENLLHRSQILTQEEPRFAITNRIPFAGRVWTLVHRTTPDFEKTLEQGNVSWVFGSGLAVSMILFGVTFFLAKARGRAEESEWELLVERERLRASEELHRTIAETAADAIITIDADSKIITVNRAAERIFGYRTDEMTGQSLMMLMPERMRTLHHAGLVRYLEKGEKGISWSGVELPGLHKDGREIPLEISFGEIQKNGRRIFTGIIRDITERKKAEEQIRLLNRDLERRVVERTTELQEANTQMEAFVYSIAHDLRAPLRSMRGFAQALREDYASSLDEEGRDFAARIISSAKFMDDLINDLLSFSRITRAHLELVPVNVERVLDEAQKQLVEEISTSKARIEIADNLPWVVAHETTLRQVLINLLSNALKFVEPGITPQIVIRVEDADSRWRISIKDNGIGIAEQYRDRIFGIFERLHGGAYSGTGIGLAIVRKGVERMNGRVGFESELGQGSRFWFELPKARQMTNVQ